MTDGYGNGNDADIRRQIEAVYDSLPDAGVPWNQPVERRGRKPKPGSAADVAAKASRVKDSWSFLTEDDVDTREYSPFKVYTRATNKHDHSKQAAVSLAPIFAGLCEEFVQARHVPAYRSLQDLIRDALFHRLKWWAENMDNPQLLAYLDEDLALQEFAMDTDRRQAELAEFERVFAMADQVLSVMQRGADILAMEVQKESYLAMAERFREPYKTRLTELVERYR